MKATLDNGQCVFQKIPFSDLSNEINQYILSPEALIDNIYLMFLF